MAKSSQNFEEIPATTYVMANATMDLMAESATKYLMANPEEPQGNSSGKDFQSQGIQVVPKELQLWSDPVKQAVVKAIGDNYLVDTAPRMKIVLED